MIRLTAYQTTTILPNPEWIDSENLMDEVIVKRVMEGGRHVYVKTKDSRRKLLFNFKLSRLKSLELRAFIQSYFSSIVTLIDHLDQTWIGNFTINPFEFTSTNAEIINIQLEFEGKKQ